MKFIRYRINIRRGLFYAKMPKSKYFIRLPLDYQVWDVVAPQGDLRSKNSIKQNVLRISFRRHLFCVKTPNSVFCIDSPQNSPFGGGGEGG
jgi:hypothetical protein